MRSADTRDTVPGVATQPQAGLKNPFGVKESGDTLPEQPRLWTDCLVMRKAPGKEYAEGVPETSPGLSRDPDCQVERQATLSTRVARLPRVTNRRLLRTRD